MPKLTQEETELLAGMPTPEEGVIGVVNDMMDELVSEMIELSDPDGWEHRVATDSEWHTATPAPPLVDLAPQLAESASEKWDGPLKVARRTPFDDVFDAEMLESYLVRQPAWKTLTGRFEVFELDRLRDLFDNNSYSTFLNRPILTFKDVCDHSMQLAMFWAQEDESLEAAAQEEPEWAPPPPASDNRQERLDLAKAAWKEAVALRKEAMEKWDKYVAEMRLRYQYEKTKR
jgi:hypothetical protein